MTEVKSFLRLNVRCKKNEILIKILIFLHHLYKHRQGRGATTRRFGKAYLNDFIQDNHYKITVISLILRIKLKSDKWSCPRLTIESKMFGKILLWQTIPTNLITYPNKIRNISMRVRIWISPSMNCLKWINEFMERGQNSTWTTLKSYYNLRSAYWQWNWKTETFEWRWENKRETEDICYISQRKSKIKYN